MLISSLLGHYTLLVSKAKRGPVALNHVLAMSICRSSAVLSFFHLWLPAQTGMHMQP
jgi:hypothetical protein